MEVEAKGLGVKRAKLRNEFRMNFKYYYRPEDRGLSQGWGVGKGRRRFYRLRERGMRELGDSRAAKFN